MRKRRLSCLILLVPILLVCWMLIGVSFNFSGQSPLQKLESTRKVWDQQGIDDYKMTVAFGSYSYVGRFYFTIQDNQIVHIDTVENAFRLDVTPIAAQDDDLAIYATQFGSYGSFPTSLNDYTMDSLFDFASEKVASEPTMPLVAWCNIQLRDEVEFNSDLGYIESFHRTDCPRSDFGGGLLCPVISHCSSGFLILDFKPLG